MKLRRALVAYQNTDATLRPDCLIMHSAGLYPIADLIAVVHMDLLYFSSAGSDGWRPSQILELQSSTAQQDCQLFLVLEPLQTSTRAGTAKETHGSARISSCMTIARQAGGSRLGVIQLVAGSFRTDRNSFQTD